MAKAAKAGKSEAGADPTAGENAPEGASGSGAALPDGVDPGAKAPAETQRKAAREVEESKTRAAARAAALEATAGEPIRTTTKGTGARFGPLADKHRPTLTRDEIADILETRGVLLPNGEPLPLEAIATCQLREKGLVFNLASGLTLLGRTLPDLD